MKPKLSENFDEAYASFVTCDVADLSGLALGQFGWATMMTATEGNYSQAMSTARDLFERGARKGNLDSVVMLAELLYGDADLSLPGEPLKARCLEAVADRASPRDFANIGAVRECLAERDCLLIDERLVFCPTVASPLATELREAVVLLGFMIQPSGAVSGIRVIEERGDTRWTDEAGIGPKADKMEGPQMPHNKHMQRTRQKRHAPCRARAAPLLPCR